MIECWAGRCRVDSLVGEASQGQKILSGVTKYEAGINMKNIFLAMEGKNGSLNKLSGHFPDGGEGGLTHFQIIFLEWKF